MQLLTRGRRAAALPVVLLITLLAGVALLWRPRVVEAHEIPERVAITLLARPDGDRLRLLVRVPLESMRDVIFPLRADGTLALADIAPFLQEAIGVWLVPGIRIFENGQPLGEGQVIASRLAAPGDGSFARFDEALRAVTNAPLPDTAHVRFEQALLDVQLEYPIAQASSRFAIEPELAHLGVRTVSVLRLVLADGTERAFTYTGDPGRVELDPRWYQAARTFVVLGFDHILEGLDHLLFVFCLVIPVRRWRPLLAIVSAFTVAHSLTLAAAALGFAPSALWFPPLVETLIAGSIVFMAAENVLRDPAALERRWPLAFGFGLVHGVGFSFALRESLQLAGGHLAWSLAAFNIGVELGQLLVLVLVVPVLALVTRRVASPRALSIVLSALVAHTAWHWMTERGGELLQYDLSLDLPRAVLLLAVVRGLLLLTVAAGVAWALSGTFDRLSKPRSADTLA